MIATNPFIDQQQIPPVVRYRRRVVAKRSGVPSVLAAMAIAACIVGHIAIVWYHAEIIQFIRTIAFGAN